MKILKLNYGGLDHIWTKAEILVEYEGKNYTGIILLENDGRDIEFQGELENFVTKHGWMDLMDEVWDDERIGPICDQGYKEWEKEREKRYAQ